jgi:anti-anti-sigma factor
VADLKIRSAPVAGLPCSAEIVIDGPVTHATADALKASLDRAVDRTTAFVSVLMKAVSYMNSAGFGCFVDLATSVERRGGAVVLVEVQPKVKLVFNHLGIGRYFRFDDSDETARAFLRAQAERVARSPRVVPLNGVDEGAHFPIVGTEIRIGSDPRSTIPVHHSQVEPRHAEVYRTGDQCFVRDLGTRLGTFVGDRKVNDEALKAGDVIRIGTLRLAFFPAGATGHPAP